MNNMGILLFLIFWYKFILGLFKVFWVGLMISFVILLLSILIKFLCLCWWLLCVLLSSNE